jgi:hypothetical protein
MNEDRVQWRETDREVWQGYVDGEHTYRVLVVGEPGPNQFPVFVHRVDARSGRETTNVSRAMDLAELNERFSTAKLARHGLDL